MKTAFRFQFDVFVVSVALVVIALAAVYKYSTRSDGSAMYLPVGTMIPAVTQTGMLAPTTGEPIPVLLNVSGQVSLPNDISVTFTKCFIVAEGKGDIQTERVAVTAKQITCFDEKKNVVINKQIKGWVVDADGKAGVAGEIKTSPVKLITQAFDKALADAGVEVKKPSAEEMAPVVEVPVDGKVTVVLSEGVNLPLKTGHK